MANEPKKSAAQLDREIAEHLVVSRGPKKIRQPPADLGRHPSQHARDRRVAQYNAAKRDVDIEAYTRGQQAAKRTIQGRGGSFSPQAFDRKAALVAYDATEEGRIDDAHEVLGLGLGALHSWDDLDPSERTAYRSGYVDGFTARVRKLAYPGQRVRGTREDK